MTDLKAIYLVVTGASSARLVPDLLEALAAVQMPLYTLLTEAAYNIISPYNLADLQGHTLVDSYFDPVLVDEREPGLTLVAPATFNTVNKITQGIADTLPHSLIAEAIGAGWPVIVVPAMNSALVKHPRFDQSIETLQQWGVKVLEPRLAGDLLMMAPVEEIIETVKSALSDYQ